MGESDIYIIASAIISLTFQDFSFGLVKLLLFFMNQKIVIPYFVYIIHILFSSFSQSIQDQTCLCLILYSFPKSSSHSSFQNKIFLQVVIWLLFAGIFTSDLIQIFPSLFTIFLQYMDQSRVYENEVLESDIKEISHQNREYQEKIEAYRKISVPITSLSTSRRTALLINKLKSMKHQRRDQRSLTEGSDIESNSSEIDLENDACSKSSAKVGSVYSGNGSSSVASGSNDNPPNPTITNDEIKDIINTLISQEYLILNPEKCKDNEVDIMTLAIEAKNIFTQSIENLPGSSHRVIKIPKVKVKRIQSIRSMIEVSEALSEVLESIGEWDFDCFELIKVTKDPAFEVGVYVFNVLNLLDRFSIENSVLRNFLTAVEHGYNRLNFYHNSIHAADVTASTVFLMQKGLSRCGNLIDLDAFALVVAAICHDIGHPGVNNAFLVATSNELALKYNDHSCLENMHANKAFTILSNDNCNILKSLNKADFQRFRKNVLSVILSTDLQVHFDKLNDFRNNLEKKLDLTDDKFRILALQMCLKCADIGHGARKLNIHMEWTSLITKEFFRQGELEMQERVPLSPLCDRSTCIISKSQVGFLEVLVKPLFKVWEEFVIQNNEEEESELEVKICMKNIIENIEFWDNEYMLVQPGKPEFILDNNRPPLSN